MDGTGTTKGQHRDTTQVFTLFHGVHPRCCRHVLVHQFVYASGGVTNRKTELIGDDLERLLVGDEIQRHVATEEVLRIEQTQEQVGVGDRRPISALSVAGWTGGCPR